MSLAEHALVLPVHSGRAVITTLSSAAPSTYFALSGGVRTLTIGGTGFAAPAAVKVGTADCGAVAVVSSTQITCEAPTMLAAGTHTVKVIVNTVDSTSTMDVIYLGAASVTSLVRKVGGGTSVRMTGNVITITGTALGVTGGTAVFVGVLGTTTDQCTSVTVNAAATEVECTAPGLTTSGSKVVDVRVMGQAAAVTGSVTYQAPIVASLSASSVPLTGGTRDIVVTGAPGVLVAC